MKTSIKPLPEFRFEVNCAFGKMILLPQLKKKTTQHDVVEYLSYQVMEMEFTISGKTYKTRGEFNGPEGKVYFTSYEYGEIFTDNAMGKIESLFLNDLIPYFMSINIQHLAYLNSLNKENDKLTEEIKRKEKEIQDMRDREKEIFDSFDMDDMICLSHMVSGTLKPLN